MTDLNLNQINNRYIKVSVIFTFYKDNHILMVKPIGKEMLNDIYVLPGGSVNDNELISETLVREVFEEFNLIISDNDVIYCGLVDIIDGTEIVFREGKRPIYIRHKHKEFSRRLMPLFIIPLANLPRFKSELNKSHGEFSDIKWVSLDDLYSKEYAYFNINIKDMLSNAISKLNYI